VLLLPFDIRADRVGWTVFAVATGRPASLDDVPLVGLSLEDAEALANGLNAVEVKCTDLARRRVLDDLGTAWLYNSAEDRLPKALKDAPRSDHTRDDGQNRREVDRVPSAVRRGPVPG
jgi:hypothetical protein